MHAPRNLGTCVVCDEPVTAVSIGSEAVCTSAHCRVLLDRRAAMTPAAFRFQVETRRRQRRELRERSESDRQRVAERSAREAREHEALRAAACRHEPLPESTHPLVVLPRAPDCLEPLSSTRRERYRAHLEDIIAKADASADATEVVPEPASAPDRTLPVPLASQFCTLCRGGCCTGGDDSAYLNAATMRRVLRQRPGVGADALLEQYLARLADETVAGSCINHTGAGCSLPREMRSDACNDFYCDSLRAWQTRCATDAPPVGAFVVQRHADVWARQRPDATNDVVGVGVVTADGHRPLDIAAPLPAPQSESPAVTG